MPTTRKKVTITAQNQFSEWIWVRDGHRGTVTITGAGSCTLTLQSELEEPGATPIDIDTLATPPDNPRYWFFGGDNWWRIGCKTGDFTSGTIEVTIQAPSAPQSRG